MSEFLFKIYHSVFLCRAKYVAYDVAVLVTNQADGLINTYFSEDGVSELEMERNSPSSLILISLVS